jgi:hypothetical protein
MGSPSTPSAPDPAKSYEQGIQVYLKYLPQLLAAEQSSREQYDPQRIAEQQGLQDQFGPTQYNQQVQALQQLDPTYLSGHDQLGAFLGNELASGSSLTPEEQKQVEGYARAAQSARGNVLGNAPATAEAYALGDRGRQILQQRVSNMSGFLAAPTIPQVVGQIQPVSADQSSAYANPAAGYQGQNFALQNYQNMLGASQLSGGNPWGSALGGAASGAATGYATTGSPYGAVIGGVAGGLGGYFSSDRRLKRDIVKVGEMNGIGIYEYGFIGFDQDARYLGVMADEAELVVPEAVITGPGGFKLVSYEMLMGQLEKEV